MPLKLSDQELDALEELPYLHRVLYIFGIRKYMDYKTGITGIKRGISYQSLGEELYVAPHVGPIENGSPSRQQIRRAVKFLEKAGLIVIKSVGKRLIFECLLAESDKFVQNKPDTNPTPQPDTKADTSENKKNPIKTDVTEKQEVESNTKPDTVSEGKPDTPPYSGKNTTIPTYLRASNFFEMLGSFGFRLPYLTHKKTVDMITAWEKAGVTIEDAFKRIQHRVKEDKDVKQYPTYYQHIVMQPAQDLTGDVKNEAERAKPRKQRDSNRKVSSTQSYWDWSKRKSEEGRD